MLQLFVHCRLQGLHLIVLISAKYLNFIKTSWKNAANIFYIIVFKVYENLAQLATKYEKQNR
jgi:hypothetical protein